MRIPPPADKWIVFGVFTGTGAIHIFGSRGILDGPFEWAFVSFGMGSVFALMYILWSAAWRRIMRRAEPPRRHLRLIINATFGLLAIGMIWMPIPAFKVTIDLPKKVEIQR